MSSINIKEIFDSKEINKQEYKFVNLKKIFNKYSDLKNLPFSMKILFENCIRNATNQAEFQNLLTLFKNWLKNENDSSNTEIAFFPSRVLMQDFTGVPAVVDLAAMRDAAFKASKDPEKINPLIPVDLVIDHSVRVDFFGSKDSLRENIEVEMRENIERYKFLKWGQKSFKNFRLVPPGMGICHQVNLEYLASVIIKNDESKFLYPETIVGTDSHTTMINGLGVVGWGVGGIEAESAMLGEAISMNMPKVVGFKLHGALQEFVTATDLVLTVTNILRKIGVVGKFVEFYGSGMSALSLPDRATIANMAPEYGATCGFFPVDKKTIEYLEISGRKPEQIDLIEQYCKSQMLFSFDDDHLSEKMHFSDYVELDLSNVKPCVAGPTRPQDLRRFSEIFDSLKEKFPNEFSDENLNNIFNIDGQVSSKKSETCFLKEEKVWASVPEISQSSSFENRFFDDYNSQSSADHENHFVGNEACKLKKHDDLYQKQYLKNGDIVLAAITSCTNTSNPSVLIAAGLLAKAAYEEGLRVGPLVKTSLAPGSKVVTDYLKEAGLLEYLEKLGFNVVGYGCTTCIGNSGHLDPEIEKIITENDLCVGAVLSGNRNFEGRVQPFIKANYLASPPLVVAFALAGSLLVNFDTDYIGMRPNGKKIMLNQIWPSNQLIQEYVDKFVKKEIYLKEYATIFDGDSQWQKIESFESEKYDWDEKSTYIKNPPYFADFSWKSCDFFKNLENARILALLGNSITTDHISPAGSIKKDSAAGIYLLSHGIDSKNFNSYGSRRGNHEVMIRGTFANIRLSNFIAKDDLGQIKHGGYTKYFYSQADEVDETKINDEMVNSELLDDVVLKKNNLASTEGSIFDCFSGHLISIYEASMKYQEEKIPLVIFAGKDYGSGSSRDWAAKGTALLGIKAVIARSFERIHRSNLIGMGVFPFIFKDFEMSFEKLEMSGNEFISIDFSKIKKPLQEIDCKIEYQNGEIKIVKLVANIFNDSEIETLLFGGIMQKVLIKIYH